MFLCSKLIFTVFILVDLRSVVSNFHFDETERIWTDALDFCRDSTPNGNLIQAEDLSNLSIDEKRIFWIGANDFSRVDRPEWRWIDGSIVDSTATPWCSDRISTGSHCLAFDPQAKCFRAESCRSFFSVVCVREIKTDKSVQRSLRVVRQTNSQTCGTVYAGSYGSWWTYAMILLNWFALFCFANYLIYRLLINKRAAFVIILLGVVSLISIVTFAVIWALQYKDLTRLPLVVVVVGSFSALLLLVGVFILVSNRIQVRRSLACRVVTSIAFLLQCGLMTGVAICFAFCTGYISLASTTIDKDIIASILASIAPAVSIILFTGILYLIGHPNDERLQTPRSNTIVNERPAAKNNVVTTRRFDQVERATSPVDARILEEFYADRPREMHSYQLDGRRYVVFEGKTLTELDTLRRELTQAILSHDSHALRDASIRAKRSAYATALAEEIQRADDLIHSLK